MMEAGQLGIELLFHLLMETDGLLLPRLQKYLLVWLMEVQNMWWVDMQQTIPVIS